MLAGASLAAAAAAARVAPDVLLQSPTGSGKTLAYLLPMLAACIPARAPPALIAPPPPNAESPLPGAVAVDAAEEVEASAAEPAQSPLPPNINRRQQRRLQRRAAARAAAAGAGAGASAGGGASAVAVEDEPLRGLRGIIVAPSRELALQIYAQAQARVWLRLDRP
jgi:hypothetical protein